MFQVAFVLLCSAQIVHFTRHWMALSRVLYHDHRARRLRSHLDWSRTMRERRLGDTRPGSAMRRSA